MTDWITDRLPTLDDADNDGEVKIQRTPGKSPTELWNFTNYRVVVPGQPWWSCNAQRQIDDAAEAAAVDPIPTARKIVQIVVAPIGLYALCDDGSLWFRADEYSGWYRHASIPQGDDA